MHRDHDDEPALLRASLGGDPDAFTALYARYAPMIHAIALGRAHRADADDIVQDTFLRAWQRLPDLHDLQRFGPWLAAIARNLANDTHRRAKPLALIHDQLPGTHRPTAEADEVLQHLRALPEAYREPLIMRLLEGMTGPEIAQRTGLTPGSVRVNLHRGMKLLRQRLGLEDTP